MIEELEALKESIAGELKTAMTELGETKMIVCEYKLSFTDAKREALDKNVKYAGWMLEKHQSNAHQRAK